MTCTLDHRFADGSAAALVAGRLREFIENPDLMEKKYA